MPPPRAANGPGVTHGPVGTGGADVVVGADGGGGAGLPGSVMAGGSQPPFTQVPPPILNLSTGTFHQIPIGRPRDREQRDPDHGLFVDARLGLKLVNLRIGPKMRPRC